MQPSITSYDYHAPISEAGDIGQPGIGGPNKYLVCTFASWLLRGLLLSDDVISVVLHPII